MKKIRNFISFENNELKLKARLNCRHVRYHFEFLKFMDDIVKKQGNLINKKGQEFSYTLNSPYGRKNSQILVKNKKYLIKEVQLSEDKSQWILNLELIETVSLIK